MTQRTPLYQSHVELGAKIVPFAGWEMPVQYPLGLIGEHTAVRTNCGIFDVSHMGEISVRGVGAHKFIQKMTCNDLNAIDDGKAQYTAFLNQQGGVVDDLIVYQNNKEDLFLCVNASNISHCMEWLTKHGGADKSVTIKDESHQWGQVALQGPKAWEILEKGIGSKLEMKFFGFKNNVEISGVRCMIARTGYTGEDGCEIFIPVDQTRKIWDLFVSLGATPCGLGARDTLRLEAALSLHGHELLTDRLASESGISWIIKAQKGDFIGRDYLENNPPKFKTIGFELAAPGIARHGDKVFDSATNKEVGVVTSGTRSPTLGKSIGLCYLPKEVEDFYIVVRDNKIAAKKVSLPFYKRAK